MKKPIQIYEVVNNNRNAYWTNHEAFLEAFGVELSDYMDVVSGFDIIKFDHKILGDIPTS